MTVCARSLLISLTGIFIFLGASIFTSLKASPASSPIYSLEQTGELSPLFLARSNLIRTRESDEVSHSAWSQISRRRPAVEPKRDVFFYAFQTITRDIDKLIHRTTVERVPYLSVTLNPAEFRVRERQEIAVTVALKNESNRQVRIIFPTSQRIEIVLKDKVGQVIEKWSDGRSFDPLEEIVVVNPNEIIEYSQQIPTREMKGGEVYSIEASLFNNPQYAKTITVYPK